MAKSLADLLKEARQKMGSNTVATVKPVTGKTVWRILPSIDPANPLAFYREFGLHWVKDVDGKLQAAAVCEEITFGTHCAVCEALAKAKLAAPTEDIKKALDEAYAKRVYLMNALCVEGPKQGEAVILEVGKKVMLEIINQMEEHEEILDPGPAGCDVVITREGTGLTTKYSVVTRGAAKSKPVAQSILDQRRDLEAYVRAQMNETKKTTAISTFGTILGDFAALAKPVNQTAARIVAPRVPAAVAAAMEAADAELVDPELLVATPPKPAAPAPAAVSMAEFEGELTEDDINKMLGL